MRDVIGVEGALLVSACSVRCIDRLLVLHIRFDEGHYFPWLWRVVNARLLPDCLQQVLRNLAGQLVKAVCLCVDKVLVWLLARLILV